MMGMLNNIRNQRLGVEGVLENSWVNEVLPQSEKRNKFMTQIWQRIQSMNSKAKDKKKKEKSDIGRLNRMLNRSCQQSDQY